MAVGTLRRMGRAFVGSEAIASRAVTPYVLRSKFVALYPDVHIPRVDDLTAVDRAHAAWLWSGRRGIVAGQSTAAIRGKWSTAVGLLSCCGRIATAERYSHVVRPSL